MKFVTGTFTLGFLLLSSLFLQINTQCNSVYPTLVYNNTAGYVTSKSQVFAIGVATSQNTIANYYNFSMLMSLAVDFVNNRTDILPDVRLELYNVNFGYSDANALTAVTSLINNNNIRSIISSFKVSETKVVQLLGRIYGVPQLTLTIANELSNRNNYPLLSRIMPSELVQAKAISRLLVMNKWSQVLLIYSDDEAGVSGFELLKSATDGLNITIYSIQIRTGNTNSSEYIPTIKSLVERYRLRVFVHYSDSNAGEPLAIALKKEGLMGTAKYAHIYSYTMAIIIYAFPARTGAWSQGGVGFLPRAGTGSDYSRILQRYRANAPGLSDPFLGWYACDSILAIAYSLDKMMKDGYTLDKVNGTTHMKYFRSLSFQGTTGNVSLDDSYENHGDYKIMNYGLTNTSQTLPIEVGYYSDITANIKLNKPIVFAENASQIADGVCTCHFGTCDENDVCHCTKGYSGVTCNEVVKSGGFGIKLIIIVVFVPTLLIFLMAAAATRYARYKRASAIKDVAARQKSNINRADIVLNQAIGRGASGVVFRAMFRGTDVAVKRILTEDVSKKVLEEFELESAVMAGLRHPNIVLFMGSCLVPEEKEMLLVMEFMEKGSLHDVLHNPKVNFTLEMGLHIASQAAKGMNFLHQATPPIIHSDLKSHNILLDDKWNARIADFGITKMKDLTNARNAKIQDEPNSLGTIFWTAPEVFEGSNNTEKSDCYSFGIVLWEIAHRQNPYEGKEPMAVALDVARNALRPLVTAKMIPEYEVLMRDCWAQDPESRPSFEEITQRLRQLTMKYPVGSYGSHDTKTVEPPSGLVYFVQTEIDGGNSLWDKLPNEMLAAVEIHNNQLRSDMENYEGYEVEFEGDGFLVAFEDITNAMNFCIASQVSLLNVEWPRKITSNPATSRVVSSGGEVIWNGLRVRMSVHSGVPSSSIDITTGRMKYFGPVVERLRKLLNSSPGSASIVTTAATIEQINTKNTKFIEGIVHKACGQVSDTSRTKTESIYSVLPKSLEDRLNTLPQQTNSMPYTVLDIDDDVATINPSPRKQEELPWLVKFDQLSIKESVGKGAIGDYYRALWNGREIAIKALINQKLEESDILHLKARVSSLSKLKHKNLMEVFGVCFEPGHISLLTEFMPKAGLRQILSNESIPLSWATKIKIAKQVADGMTYLSTFEDPGLHIHANLKSGNVLVNLNSGEVKVADFGQGSLKDLARTMTSVGTVAWTAPEVLNGEELSPSISVYSFGIIMHELLTRKMPYPNEHPIKLVAKVLAGQRPTIPADCPHDYKELMEQCWSAEPTARPSWANIANKLSQILASSK